MTAQAVAPSLPPDSAPNPPAAPATGGGSHFLAVLGGKSATNATSASAPSNGQVPSLRVTHALTPRKSADTANQGNNGTQEGTNNSNNSSDGAPNVIAVPVPLLAQLQQPPAPFASAAATAPITTAPVAAQTTAVLPALSLPIADATIKWATLPSSANGSGTTSSPLPAFAPPLGALASAAALSAPAAQSGAATPSARASGSPAAAASTPATSVAVPGVTVSTDQQGGNTPPLASTINARLASGAAVLVSQPRVALASLTSAGDKPAAKVAASDSGLPTNARQLAAVESGHDAAEPAPAPAAHAEQTLGTGKESAATPASLLESREATAREPALPPVTDNATGVTNAPPPPPIIPASAPSQSETVATLPIVPHAVAEQVAINVHQAVKSGIDHIQIQLQPADLGAIDVKLNVNHDGRVTVVVSADRSDTLNLLQQDASGLTQALRDAGLQTDNSSLSFNLRGGFQFQQQQSQGSAASLRDGAYSSDGDGSDVIAAPEPTLRRHAGALDIHV